MSSRAKITTVPNQPKTPISSFRIPQDVKQAAADKAKRDGKSLTDVVVEALKEYAAKP